MEGFSTKGRSKEAKSIFPENSYPCSNRQALVMWCVKRVIALSGLSGCYTKSTGEATNEPISALKYSTDESASSFSARAEDKALALAAACRWLLWQGSDERAAASVRKPVGFDSITYSSSVMLYYVYVTSVDRVSLGLVLLRASWAL